MKYIIKEVELYEKIYEINEDQNNEEFKYRYILKFKPKIKIYNSETDSNNMPDLSKFKDNILITKYKDHDENIISIIYYELLYTIEDENVFNEILKLNEDYFEAIELVNIDNTFDIVDKEAINDLLLYDYSTTNFNTLEEINKIKELLSQF